MNDYKIVEFNSFEGHHCRFIHNEVGWGFHFSQFNLLIKWILCDDANIRFCPASRLSFPPPFLPHQVRNFTFPSSTKKRFDLTPRLLAPPPRQKKTCPPPPTNSSTGPPSPAAANSSASASKKAAFLTPTPP